MNKRNLLLTGLGVGAGLMYVFDPDRGRRRRAQMRDAVVHLAHVTDKAIGKTSRDLSNRMDGLMAETRSMFRRDEVSDELLAARVRSGLGRVVSHPHAIDVTVSEGVVSLKGPILAAEADPLHKTVRSLCGVKDITDELELHQEGSHIPSLQGGRHRRGHTFELWQSNWTPAARALTGAAGGAMALYGAVRKGFAGRALELLGLGLLARGLTNQEVKDLIGLNGGRGIEVQKAISIDAPVAQVYELWSNHENFPHFMSNVREVKKLAEGRYHWTVIGPAGMTVEWEGEMVRQIPNELIEFRNLPGSGIEQHGIVRFLPNGNGGTVVDVKMSYHPPAGALGHAVAKLFGADPKSEIIADLNRMKTFIETGHQPHDAAERRFAAQTVQAG